MEPTKKTFRVIGYTRISTQEQAREHFSEELQEYKIKSFCSYKGLELVKIIKEIHSSAHGKLKLLDEAVNEVVNNDKIDGLIVAFLHRLGRNDIGPRIVAKRLLMASKELYCEDLGGSSISTTPGYMLFSVQVMAANIENLTKRDITKSALSRIRKEEGRVTFKPWMGYQFTKDKQLELHPHNGFMVKRIFELTAKGGETPKTLSNIIKLFYEDGGFRLVTADLCRKILKRELYYTGRYLNIDTEIVFPPIVSKELWLAANAKLRRRGEDSRRLRKQAGNAGTPKEATL